MGVHLRMHAYAPLRSGEREKRNETFVVSGIWEGKILQRCSEEVSIALDHNHVYAKTIN